jgi:hypothetical protein
LLPATVLLPRLDDNSRFNVLQYLYLGIKGDQFFSDFRMFLAVI